MYDALTDIDITANVINKDSDTGIQGCTYQGYQTIKPLFRHSWVERRTKWIDKTMTMLAK